LFKEKSSNKTTGSKNKNLFSFQKPGLDLNYPL
jgi:hypothetical protein